MLKKIGVVYTPYRLADFVAELLHLETAKDSFEINMSQGRGHRPITRFTNRAKRMGLGLNNLLLRGYIYHKRTVHLC